jgi:hypothetical protein
LFIFYSIRGVKKTSQSRKSKKIKNTELIEKTEENDFKIIVFKPSPVQGPDSGF